MASAFFLFLLMFPNSFSSFMMYDRRKGVHGRYGNVPVLCAGFLYCTLRVSLKVLEI